MGDLVNVLPHKALFIIVVVIKESWQKKS